MMQYTLAVEGMACSMCEAHINQAVRRAFPAKKVTSSHTKGQTVILSEHELDEDALRRVIAATGYQVLSIRARPAQKKGLLSSEK